MLASILNHYYVFSILMLSQKPIRLVIYGIRMESKFFFITMHFPPLISVFGSFYPNVAFQVAIFQSALALW